MSASSRIVVEHIYPVMIMKLKLSLTHKLEITWLDTEFYNSRDA